MADDPRPVPGYDAVDLGHDGLAITYFDDGSTITWRIDDGSEVAKTAKNDQIAQALASNVQGGQTRYYMPEAGPGDQPGVTYVDSSNPNSFTLNGVGGQFSTTGTPPAGSPDATPVGVNPDAGMPPYAPGQPSRTGGSYVYSIRQENGRWVPIRRATNSGFWEVVPASDISEGANKSRAETNSPYGDAYTNQRAFTWEGMMEGTDGDVANAFGRSDSPSGLSTQGITDYPLRAKQRLIELINSGRIKVNSALGTQVAQAVAKELGVAVDQTKLAPAGSPAANAASSTTTADPKNDPVSAAMVTALSGRMHEAATDAAKYSEMTGFVMEPKFDDKTGTWTYGYRMENGQKVPVGGLTKSQIEDNAASAVLKMAQATGQFKDENGVMQKTPTAILQLSQSKLADAQATQLAEDTTLKRQQQAFDQSKVVADLASNPRSYITGAMMGAARGGLAGQMPDNQVGATTRADGMWSVPNTPGYLGQTGGAPGNVPQFGYNPTLTTQNNGSPQNYQPADSGFFKTQTVQNTSSMAGTPSFQPLGYPGGDDHIATASLPGGSMHFYSSPNYDASIPVSAATRALLQGQSVPSFGGLMTNGGYANQSQLSGLNTNQIMAAQYNKLRPSEQQQTKAVFSLAGYSDDDFDAAMKANLPTFGGVGGSVKPTQYGYTGQ